MSRLHASQVIALGEYLNTDFNPASLTVSQLLGIFNHHDIAYPTPYTKPKLVQLFKDKITANSAKLKRQRIKRENSVASDDGITDGVTGRPLNEKIPLARRSTRRLSKIPDAEEEDSEPAHPDPPKRRRSSAQPTLGRASSSRQVAAQPPLAEESEPEEVPVAKVRRTKKKVDDAATRVRRVSDGFGEDSAWEDNNIFQSGAESSSPARPSPKPRKSVAPRKSRKASSAPPEMSPSPTKRLSLPPPLHETTFDPDIPLEIKQESRRTSLATSPGQRMVAVPSMVLEEDEPVSGIQTPPEEVEPVGDTQVDDEDYGKHATHNNVVARRIADGGKSVTRRQPQTSASRPSWLIRTALILLALGASGGLVAEYKTESASVGYCDTGKDTNQALDALKVRWEAIEECNRANSSVLLLPPFASTEANDDLSVQGANVEACPPLPLTPRPAHCTPCPAHATCTQRAVTCDTGFLLRPHWLLAVLPPPSQGPSQPGSATDAVWRAIHAAMDGLPGLGPVAFPPKCVEDPTRKRNIGVLGKAVGSVLRQERGLRLCSGSVDGVEVKPADGGEAKKWGVDLDGLKETMKRKTAPHLLDTFDDTFHEAIQQLVKWGNVMTSEDQEGHQYLAAEIPDLSWSCAVTVKARQTWIEWRSSVLTTLLVILLGFVQKGRLSRRRVEDKRVSELVQIALDTLGNQEIAHHTDPVSAPQPYLSSLQLRDLILQDEHSISKRAKVWDRVEQVVEGNANVRVNMEEVTGGDELRVWRWMGNATPNRRRTLAAASPSDE